ncbi:MAG: NAD(P)-dependent alcohol dehydrogenase [Ureaplasma sp.]|nr:NAD(P)-dependent alcohol dehydrogenase [Ureaplasma sp.]
MENKKIKCKAKAVMNKDNLKFQDFEFERRALKPNDILIEIKYAGICHSDIHTVREEWGNKNFWPIVPGHEIAGTVIAIGENVKKFKIGDNAGVGCMVDSCRECASCKEGYEQECNKAIFTYNSINVFADNEITYGGYSNKIVIDADFAIKVPKDAPLQYVAPLMCAGITTYAPLSFSKVKKGQKVAVAGFGGLGLMAVKYALKMGAEVYVFARNKNKEEFAKKLGVKKLYDSTKNVEERFDLIISTIPTKYDVIPYIRLLKHGGELGIVGVPPANDEWNLNTSSFIFNGSRKVYGSLIGGIDLTQEMLNYSLKHKIYPEIEIIDPNQIDEAYDKLTSGKAKFRYVIDMSKLK